MNLVHEQEMMRLRRAAENQQRTPPRINFPVRAGTRRAIAAHPVNYQLPVKYTDREPFEVACPQINGVYLLVVDDGYYIGESGDVLGRICSHRAYANFDSDYGRAFVLAEIPHARLVRSVDSAIRRDKEKRLIAECRFIAAALSLNLPLTNKLCEAQINKQLSELSHEVSVLKRVLALRPAKGISNLRVDAGNGQLTHRGRL